MLALGEYLAGNPSYRVSLCRLTGCKDINSLCNVCQSSLTAKTENHGGAGQGSPLWGQQRPGRADTALHCWLVMFPLRLSFSAALRPCPDWKPRPNLAFSVNHNEGYPGDTKHGKHHKSLGTRTGQKKVSKI